MSLGLHLVKRQDFPIKFASADFTLIFDAEQLGANAFLKTNAQAGILPMFSNFSNGRTLLKEKQCFLATMRL